MSRSESWKTWEGRVVDGKFPLRQWLGGSENSAVFLTERTGQPPQKVAIKLIEADEGEASRHLARLGPATRFSHPHLIHLFDAGHCRMEGTSVVYIVMEFAEEDLSQILPQRPLAPNEVSDMLIPLLDGLSYLHPRGYVHGHIKPSNVLAVQDQLKLSVDQITEATETGLPGRRMGMYDAPETAAGIATPESDIWSIGVTIVAALTQNVPGSAAAQGDPNIGDGIPEPFRGIARESLHIDPKRRCTLAEIQSRLQPAGRSVPAERAMDSTTSAAPDDDRGKWRFVIPVAALLVIALAWALWPKSSPPEVSSRTQPQTTPAQPSPAAMKPSPVEAPKTETAKAKPPASAPATKSTQGAVLHEVIPDVPHSARNTITGTIKVTVSTEVDSSGKVTDAHLKSAGPSRYFAGLALKAARDWEFSPPQADGKPAASSWLLQFRFKRSGTQVSPQQVQN